MFGQPGGRNGKRRERVRAHRSKGGAERPREGARDMLRCQSLEDGDGFPGLEEDEEIDQFNDDTFGAGANDDDWRGEHERLAEIEEKHTDSHLLARSSSPNTDPLGEQQEELEYSLSQLVREVEEPALPTGSRTRISSRINSSIWDPDLRPIRGPLLTEDMSPSSLLHEYGLAPMPPPGRDDPEQDASERALPRRSTSPVIGSPPVRAVPIGTPPKHVVPIFTQQQVLCPNPIHIRAASFNNHPNNPAALLRHPFPSALSPLQRAQLLGGAQAAAGRMSPSQFARTAGLHGHVGPMVTPGAGGFRPFFGVPPTAAPGAHLKNLRSPQQRQPLPFLPDTTHLHPQHRRLLFQRQQNRNQHRGLNGTGGDRSSRPQQTEPHRRDAYAGLMLQREKEWVCRIQLLQLQSTDPYHDDFYYQNYFEKLDKLSASQDRPSEGPKKERTKLITPQVAKLEHTYKPVQFEGSLGKLTVSSVNNPRKMIDAVATHRSDEEETREKQVRDKRRQTLVVIEKVFSVLLDLEDFERRFSLCCEDEEREALTEERRHKLQQLCDILRGKEGSERAAEEQFVQIMCIRKGKRLVARIIRLLPLQLSIALLSTTAQSLPFLIKKDYQDQILPCLVSPCALVISQLSATALTSLLQSVCGSGNTSSQQLLSVLQNKFGLTLVCQILGKAEELMSSENSTTLNQSLWTPLVAQVTHFLLQIQASSLAQPLCSPGTALLHFSRYLDDQTLGQLRSRLRSAPSP
ncbi:PREDICTED: protein PAT1 homolog 1 isoform X2 [Nanorana parkeri]|uniref:protein PAT1 homolog 1 isoform X2 n=1 Tax=Nanorana parkeri TaxID=125878 RepID=UPI0008545AFC|nr:PREDICTED: protein PAT1 homolog 1 isoform X2 [Nanorana parkeri]